MGASFLNIPAAGGTRTLQITSNLAWSITLPPPTGWITAGWPSGQLSGTGNAEITFTTGDNTSIPQSPTTPLSGNIIVTFTKCDSTTVSITIPISQSNGEDEGSSEPDPGEE